MTDVGVHTLFQKDMCKMVRGTMVLMKGVHIATLYKFLGILTQVYVKTSIFLKSTQIDSSQDESIQTKSTSLHQLNLTMLWHKRMGHIGEKGLRAM
jgi:hypothetical protein